MGKMSRSRISWLLSNKETWLTGDFMASYLLGDLNDYIAPAQACIIPEQGGAPTVNLTDCLACSGCVTTAETVLVMSQTHLVVREALKGNKPVVASVSPASRAAISGHFGISLADSHVKVWSFLKRCGVSMVLDTFVSMGAALTATDAEFSKRLSEGGPFPMFVSECPGWVCFVEKRHPELIEKLSPVASPQQITGSLVKQVLFEGQDVFHFAVMPCYDKKLEASREGSSVDNVISTTELLEWMIAEEGVYEQDFADPFPTLTGEKVTGVVGAAGGYLQQILRRFGDVEIRKVKSVDYTEYYCGDIVLAEVYGFKNIQTMLQRMKRSGRVYHFIEVMACPGACLYGGGQPKVQGAVESVVENGIDPWGLQERLAPYLYTTFQEVSKAVSLPRLEW